jgi:carboxyl-terminal processing protease
LAQDFPLQSEGTTAIPITIPNSGPKDTAPEDTENQDYLKSVLDMIKQKYKGDVNDKELMEGALKGMLSQMDSYTTYLTKDEASRFFVSANGKLEGIGVELGKVENHVVVLKVISGSPAEEAGIVPGDKIVDINGKNVEGASAGDVSNIIKNSSSRRILLGLIKNGDIDVTAIEVSKRYITVNPVAYDIRKDIAYIKIDSFNSNTMDFMTRALNGINAAHINKVVLDLRDNPGGEVAQVVQVARKFVPQGLITKLDFKSEKDADIEYYSPLTEPKYRLAVLVNQNSASAAEILAGAIQDTKAGTLIGTKTFGKAKVQTLVPLLTPEAYEKYSGKFGVKYVDANALVNQQHVSPLPEEILGYIKMTTGKYTTPKGRMIDGVGLTPDIQVENPLPVSNIDINSVKKLKKTLKPDMNSITPDVYSAEQILKICGYDIGTPDAKLDSTTFAAIMEFQKDNGLYPYGVLDFATQQALNDKLEAKILEVDKQYAEAVRVLESDNSGGKN